jgi:hypothetical protein
MVVCYALAGSSLAQLPEKAGQISAIWIFPAGQGLAGRHGKDRAVLYTFRAEDIGYQNLRSEVGPFGIQRALSDSIF